MVSLCLEYFYYKSWNRSKNYQKIFISENKLWTLDVPWVLLKTFSPLGGVTVCRIFKCSDCFADQFLSKLVAGRTYVLHISCEITYDTVPSNSTEGFQFAKLIHTASIPVF